MKDKRAIEIVGISITGSLIFILDQIRQINKRIQIAVSNDVLSIDRLRPEYIYIDDPYIQELLKEGKKLQDDRIKLSRLQRWFYDKIQESFIFNNWFSFKKNIAWRYLRLAESDVRSFRIRAAQALSELNHLTDSDYRQIAQSCSLRTAINLSRTEGVDSRFFLDAPYFKQNPDYKLIVKHLHDFLVALDLDGKHPCMQYFLSKNFADFTDNDPKSFDDDLTYKRAVKVDVLPMCVDAILHHSYIGANAREIVTLGGLPLLMEVYKYVTLTGHHQLEVTIMLSNILSNISVFKDCSNDLFISGWIKILTILSKHEDVRVSVPAARSLLNFDTDHNTDVTYLRRVYPLHPLTRTSIKPKLDVIFIHGLLGGAFITWRQRDACACGHKSPFELLEKPSIPAPDIGLTDCDANEEVTKVRSVDQDDFQNINLSEMSRWQDLGNDYQFVLVDIPVDGSEEINTDFTVPGDDRKALTTLCDSTHHSKCWPKDWLSADCPDVRLLAVNYETNLSMWSGMCTMVPGKRNLCDRSSTLMTALVSAGVGSRPVVWLAHSMGGLIVKDMLLQASTSQDVNKRKLLDNTKAIIFFSTPHKGSHLATLNPTTQMILYPSVEVQELRENSPALLKLHNNFLALIKSFPLKIITFAERECTYITSLKFEMKFVKQESADPDVGEVYGIPLDHLCICKPACRQSFIYQRIINLMNEILNDIKGH